MKDTIFVQVASYKDPELYPTLKGLTDQSLHPENVRVVVCWQHGDEDTLEDFMDEGFEILDSYIEKGDQIHVLGRNNARIELIDVHYLKTQGACWARNKIQQHYNNEKYTLQLDSHHRFIDKWDEELIDMLEDLRKFSKKPLLTAYVPSYDPENDPQMRVQEPWEMEFDRFIPEGAIFQRPRTMPDWQSRTHAALTRFYSGHFCFADGSFAEEVQHDPEYFFHGEEISIAVRAFTHGYDLYSPHKVIVWHEYTRKGRTKIWDDHTTIQKQKGFVKEDWYERNMKCHKRNRILFGMDGEDQNQIDFGKYGFGKERSLKEYESYAGISFKYRSITPDTLEKKEPTLDYKIWENEDEWKSSLTKSNDIRVCFAKDELKDDQGDLATDYDFWYLGCHDEYGKEVYRKDLQEHEIKKYMSDNSPYIDHRFIFMCDPNRVAKTYTVWTHSKSKGWLKKLDKLVD